jgi:hypothetical protein
MADAATHSKPFVRRQVNLPLSFLPLSSVDFPAAIETLELTSKKASTHPLRSSYIHQ